MDGEKEREREQSRKGNRRKGRRDGESSPFPDASVPSVLPSFCPRSSARLRVSSPLLSDLPADIPVLPPLDRHPPRVYAPLQTSRRRPPGVAAVPVDASRAPVHTDRPPATHNTPLIPIKRRPIRKWTNVWTYAQAPLASLVDRPNTARHTHHPSPISPSSCSTILTRHSQLVRIELLSLFLRTCVRISRLFSRPRS